MFLAFFHIGVPFQAAIGVGCSVRVILIGTGLEARRIGLFASVRRRNFRGKYGRRGSRGCSPRFRCRLLGRIDRHRGRCWHLGDRRSERLRCGRRRRRLYDRRRHRCSRDGRADRGRRSQSYLGRRRVLLGLATLLRWKGLIDGEIEFQHIDMRLPQYTDSRETGRWRRVFSRAPISTAPWVTARRIWSGRSRPWRRPWKFSPARPSRATTFQWRVFWGRPGS